MKRFAPEYVTDPAKAVYRFYRDTRFSKDKTPYKDHIAASFRHRNLGGEGGGAGFYFAVSHKEVAVGGGVYMPAPETLLAIRGHMAEFHREFETLLKARAVKRLLGDLQGEQLSRVPKGLLGGASGGGSPAAQAVPALCRAAGRRSRRRRSCTRRSSAGSRR